MIPAVSRERPRLGGPVGGPNNLSTLNRSNAVIGKLILNSTTGLGEKLATKSGDCQGAPSRPASRRAGAPQT